MRSRELIWTGLALFSFATGCVLGAESCSETATLAKELGEVRSSIAKLKQRVTCLNLINALNLSHDQILKILEAADNQRELRKRYAARAARQMKKMEQILTELKDVLEKQAPIPDDLVRRVFAAENREHRMRDTLDKEIAQNAKKLNHILTDGQLKIIEDFKPCTIPPRDLSDPVRAGQANNSTFGERLLRRVRQTPANVYRRRREEIVDRHIAEVERHEGKYTDAERRKEKKRILALLDRVRAMSDVDFEMQKAKLAAQIRPQGKIPKLMEQLEKARPHASKTKAARFLLCPEAISVLKKRAEDMAAAEP